MNKKVTLGLQSIFSVAIIFGIIVLINLISMQFFARLDLTENSIYSLSDFSKKKVAELDDDLTVKAFFTSNLPAPYSFNARFVKDQLGDYKAYSKGNFHYEFIDPSENKDLEAEAQKFGIQPAQINTIENDEVQIKKVYMGLAILYGDKQEVIPIIQSTSGLEYDITGAILKITTDEILRVGFLTGHDEPDLVEKLGKVEQLLSQFYQVMPVDLTTGEEVPEDVRTLIIAGPKKPFTDWEKFAIDQFIMRGGKIALLLDKIDTDISIGKAEKVDMSLDPWLATYGIKVNDDLVVDAQNRQITVSQRQGFMTIQRMIRYPFIPIVNEFDRENAIVKDLENVDFAFVSTIDTTVLSDSASVQFKPLAWSSPNSGKLTGQFNINPQRQFTPDEFTPGHFVLAAAYIGSFNSYFAGKSAPDPAEEDTTGTIQSKSYDKPIIEKSADNRIVVIGDADFIQDQLQTNVSNMIFFQNVVDWLTQDEGMITIRSRGTTDRPLDKVSDGKKGIVKSLNVLGMPILIIVIGVLNMFIRRSRKQKRVVVL
ncbi:MAG: hypothetical protein B6244_11700 [Candidatus Cloacimonetes bacterium 4572_55]|nr:MAG: hypothetical protein B6244_11700 [Candidatus Cloacimonetes bacterium 4572_55]